MSWFQTYTGGAFWFVEPRACDVCIDDIAHALALQCRYNGHTTKFYSVAQHSVLVSRLVSAESALWGLLHDAAEAYLGDMVSPLKRLMPEYQEAERRAMAVIAAHFGLDGPEPQEVRDADIRLLVTEQRDLMVKPPMPWGFEDIAPLSMTIWPWDCDTAEKAFLLQYRRLTGVYPYSH